MSNEKVLELLESTEEYARIMAEIQSCIVDGYMDIAETRRRAFGLSFTSINVDENTRKVFKIDEEIEKCPNDPLIPGLSQQQVKKVKDDFEKAVELAVQATKALGRLNKHYEDVEKEIKP